LKKITLIVIALSLIISISTPLMENHRASAILNYVPNFSFEEVDTSGNIIGWSKFSSNTDMSVSTDTYQSGKQSLEIVDNSSSSSMGAISDNISVIPNEKYKASAKADSTSGQIYLRFYDGSNNYISQTFAGTKTQTGWNTVEVSGQAPSNAKYARILLYSHGSRVGTIHYDSVNFQRVLKNYGFEEGSDSTIPGWTKKWGLGATLSTSQVYNGANSARIYDNSTSSPGGVESDKFVVTEGETYKVSANIFTNTSAQLYLRFHDSNGTLISSKVATYSGRMSEWSNISVSGTAPTGTKSASIIIYTTSTDTGTAYFDEVFIENADKLQLTGDLDSNELVTYSVTVDQGGVLDLVNLSDSDVDYILYNTSEEVNYINGENIPAGQYEFSVQTSNGEETGYKFVFSGIKVDYSSTSTVLPYLDVISPKSPKTYLSKDSNTTTVSGTADSPTEISQYNSNPLSVNGSFNENINIGFGKNDVSFTSTNSSQNKVIKKYDVISPGVERVTGSTASLVSDIAIELDKFHTLNDTVIIVNDSDLVSHYASLPYAYFETAPILLASSSELTTDSVNVINQLNAQKAILLGDSNKLSTNIETELLNLGVQTIERINWTTRSNLTKALAEKMLKTNSSQIILVSENSPVDAAIASGNAAQTMVPIIYNNKDTISTELQSILDTYTNINEILILGDETKISAALETSLKNYADVTRITGTGYEDLNLQFNNHNDFQNMLDTVVRSTNKYQLFSAAEMTVFRDGTLLISDGLNMSSNMNNFLSSYGGPNVYFFGDNTQLSDSFVNSQDQRIGQMFP
jgi:putative cell wall-binding protein